MPPERLVRKDAAAPEQRPITVIIKVTQPTTTVPRQPGPDRGRDGAVDRPREPESSASQHQKQRHRDSLKLTLRQVNAWAPAVKRDVLAVYLVARDPRVPGR